MRLDEEQVKAIKTVVGRHFGEYAEVWLFGSRVDDRRRGGDIDLLVCPDVHARGDIFMRKVRLLAALERALGERKVDVVIERPQDDRPIVAIAHSSGVKL